MKNLLIASLLLVSVSASAATYNCYSLEEGPMPMITVKIDQAITTSDMEGRPLKASPIEVRKYDSVVIQAIAVGTATTKTLDLVVLQEGDIAVGNLKAKEYIPGRLSGTLKMQARRTSIDTEIGCEVKK